MKISLAMATYHGAAYLPEQLESFLRQDRLPDELVVSDDRSSDATVDIIERFARRAPFEVRVHVNERNLGYSRNFANALSMCSGELILISDQDDVWHHDKLSTVERIFQAEPDLLLLVNDMEIADGELRPSGLTQLGQIRASGARRDDTLVAGCCSALRASVLGLALPLPDLDVSYDAWIHALVHPLGRRRVLERSLQTYRRHGGNASQSALSGTGAVGLADSVKVSLSVDPHDSYVRRRALIGAVRQRLTTCDRAVFRRLGMERPGPAVIRPLEREAAALTGRARLVRSSSVGRRVRAMRMLLTGDYRYFLGLRSFARDVLR